MSQIVGIVGVGLIGGSLGLDLLKQGVQVLGFDKNKKVPAHKHCVSAFVDSVAELTSRADTILIATPVSALPALFKQLQACPGIEKKILSDVGSVKQEVIEIANDVFGEVPPRFIPGHPLAGREKNTAASAQEGLFAGKRVLLTPVETSEVAALEQIQTLWQSVGARPETIDPIKHDKVLAVTSHLPHLLAYSLIHFIADKDQKGTLSNYAAGGFKDFTRIAASDPDMWREISLVNRENILEAITDFQAHLNSLSTALETWDDDKIQTFFSRAQRYKNHSDEQ